MLDIKKYQITQEELDDYISTLVIPRYTVEIKPTEDYYDLLIVLEDGKEISRGYYAYADINTSDAGKLFEEKYIDSLCEKYFYNRKLSVIEEMKKRPSTIGDLERMDDKMNDVLLACEYQNCLIELGI